MSEQTAPTEGTEETNEQGQAFEPIASQEALDKIVQARIARERAKFADYEELKAKAAKLTEFEESQKSEAEKAAERLAAAEKRAAELESQVARAEVAAAKGVPAELLTGSTREELEAAADALIKFKGEQAKGPVIPSQGDTPKSAPANADDWLRSLASK